MTYLLNILDLLFTLHALSHGAWEKNPLMRWVPGMVACKVVVVGLLCLWLDSRPEPAAKWGLRLCSAVYGAVNLWHLGNLLAVWL